MQACVLRISDYGTPCKRSLEKGNNVIAIMNIDTPRASRIMLHVL
jgi:hypothetical protein